MGKVVAVSFLILIYALAAIPAEADSVLYTTLGPGDSHGIYAYAVAGSNYSDEVIANSFTIDSASVVSDAQLAIYSAIGDDSPASVYIESDNSGSPGSILDALTQVGTIPAYESGGPVIYDCAGAGCALAAGTYWLVVSETDPNSALGWYFSSTGANTNQAFDSIGSPTGPWSFDSVTETAFEIDGPTVPEPANWLLLGSGILGMAMLIRRKRRAALLL